MSLRVAEKATFSQVFDGAPSQSVSISEMPEVTGCQFINQKDSQGMTPLQIALSKENIENAIVLIENGANIDIRYGL